MSQYLVFGEDRPCPLCGADEKAVLSRKMQFRLDCTTVICKTCGFCFVSPPPTREAYHRYYREAYSRQYWKIHRPVDAAIPLGETTADTERLDRIERHKGLRGARVLEIGPGNGRFLSLLAQRGASCAAIEPSEEFRKNLSSAGVDIIGQEGSP